MNVEEKIKKFEKEGYRYEGWKLGGGNNYIIAPSGACYLSEFLGENDCPICDQYLEDNPEESETLCNHSKDVLEEIKHAKSLNTLLDARNLEHFSM